MDSMRVYTTSLGWGILNRHFGDYCTGGDVTAPRALAQSEGLAGVAERSQFSRAVEGLPAGMSYPRWRNEANLRAWPELRNEANSGRLPTQCGRLSGCGIRGGGTKPIRGLGRSCGTKPIWNVAPRMNTLQCPRGIGRRVRRRSEALPGERAALFSIPE